MAKSPAGMTQHTAAAGGPKIVELVFGVRAATNNLNGLKGIAGEVIPSVGTNRELNSRTYLTSDTEAHQPAETLSCVRTGASLARIEQAAEHRRPL